MFICDSFRTFHASLKATFDRRGREEISPSLPLLSAVCNFQQEKEFTWYAMITLATVLDCHNKFTSKGKKCSTNRAKIYELWTCNCLFLISFSQSARQIQSQHSNRPALRAWRSSARSHLKAGGLLKRWADPENIEILGVADILGISLECVRFSGYFTDLTIPKPFPKWSPTHQDQGVTIFASRGDTERGPFLPRRILLGRRKSPTVQQNWNELKLSSKKNTDSQLNSIVTLWHSAHIMQLDDILFSSRRWGAPFEWPPKTWSKWAWLNIFGMAQHLLHGFAQFGAMSL